MKVSRPLTITLIALVISSQTTAALPQATSELTQSLLLYDACLEAVEALRLLVWQLVDQEQ
jgi:hypothetical protein